MEETNATETMWPAQDDSCLTANATSYIDDYVQAIEFEKCFDTNILGSETLYPDLYGATVDWEPLLQRKYAPETRTEQLPISPYPSVTPTAAADESYHPLARAEYEWYQTSPSSPAPFWTGGDIYFVDSNFPMTATTTFPWDDIRQQCLPTSDSLATLPKLSKTHVIDPPGNEHEMCVSPRDLVLSGIRETGSMQTPQKHEKDVLERYSRAEDEIASLSRRALHSTVRNAKRKGGGKTKQAGINRKRPRSS